MKNIFLFSLLCTPLFSATPIGISPSDLKISEFNEKVPSIRGFPTWETLQPAPGKWNLEPADKFVQSLKSSGTEITGIFHQLAPWASSSEDTPAFPVANTQAWIEYVTKLAHTYPSVSRWDVFDSFNTGSRQTNTPYHYVELLTAAHHALKEANPEAALGFTIAEYDLEFLDQALRSGAGGNFEYISLAPFHYASGSERFLRTVLPTIQALLGSYDLSERIPVGITLTGTEEELPRAAALAKSLGFDPVFIEGKAALLEEVPDAPAALPRTPDYDETVSLTFGQPSQFHGIFQPAVSTMPWDEENQAARLGISKSPPVTKAAFLVDADFVSPEDNDIQITLHISRIPSETGTTNPTGFVLTYESIHGIISTQEWWPVPGENKWQEKTYDLSDASFTGKLGWNFRIDASGAGNDLLIRKVEVTKK